MTATSKRWVLLFGVPLDLHVSRRLLPEGHTLEAELEGATQPNPMPLVSPHQTQASPLRPAVVRHVLQMIESVVWAKGPREQPAVPGEAAARQVRSGMRVHLLVLIFLLLYSSRKERRVLLLVLQ